MEGWAVLHTYTQVQGATPLLPHRGEHADGHDDAGERIVYVGGNLTELRERTQEDTSRPSAGCRLKVVYGHAAWAPGQLEGEIRAEGTRAPRPLAITPCTLPLLSRLTLRPTVLCRLQLGRGRRASGRSLR